jgi:hypothetical protein
MEEKQHAVVTRLLLAKFPNTANNCSTHGKVVARLASELAGSFILILKTRIPLAIHPPISLFVSEMGRKCFVVRVHCFPLL